MRLALRILAALALVCLLIAGGVYVATRPDIPTLIANVNGKPLGVVQLESVQLKTFYDDVVDVREGRIVVPENRDATTANKIELFFRVLPTAAAEPRPPVFFFAGGPGSSSTRVAQSHFYYLFRDIQQYADVVLLDQRGTGGSHPHLGCYNGLDLPTDVTEDVPTVAIAAVAKAVAKCTDRFREAGINLSSYNSQESARDIEDLRVALGYETISLFGYSYGTTLAQFYIRLFEDRVSRVVMAGPVGVDEALKLPSRVNGAFSGIDSLIADDGRASRYVPDFTGLMHSVHAGLRAQPQFIQIPLMDAVSDDDGAVGKAIFRTISVFKPNWNLTLTDQHLQMMIASRGGNPAWTRRLPAFYHQMSTGDYRDAGNFLRNFRRETLPNALFFTASCATRYSTDRSTAARTELNFPLRHQGISFGRGPEVCDAAGVEAQPGFSDPVSADVPVLMLAGTLDTQTPVANMRVLAERFPDPVTVVVENASHTDLLFPETGDLIAEFLEGPPRWEARDLRLRRPIAFDAIVPHRYSLGDTLYAVTRKAGVEAAVARYEVIRSEFADQDDYHWDLSENALNALGYRMLADGMTDEAIRVFELNTEVFPEAFNPFNSLGEAYLLAGRRADARRALVRAVELNRYDGNSYKLLNEISS